MEKTVRLFNNTERGRSGVICFDEFKRKPIFPHKDSKVIAGLVLINEVIEKEKVCFAIGQNVKTVEIKESMLLDLLQHFPSLSEIIKIETDFGHVDVLRGVDQYRVVLSNGNEYDDDILDFRGFDESQIVAIPKNDLRNVIWKHTVLEKELLLLKSMYFGALPSKILDLETISLTKFMPEKLASYVKEDIVDFCDICSHIAFYGTDMLYHDFKSLKNMVDSTFYDKLPIKISQENLTKLSLKERVELFVDISEYNINIINWWKKSGLKKLAFNLKYVSLINNSLKLLPVYHI